LEVAERRRLELAAGDERLAQCQHQGARLAAGVARGRSGAEPVAEPFQERGVGAAGVGDLLAPHPRALGQQLGLVQLALDLAFEPQAVPADRRADEFLGVEMFGNQLRILPSHATARE
jgi:hypothetical protein